MKKPWKRKQCDVERAARPYMEKMESRFTAESWLCYKM